MPEAIGRRSRYHCSVVDRTRFAAAAILMLTCAGACRETPKEPMTLEGNLLTVDNRTNQEWRGVEVWLNHYYRVTAPSIPAGGRFQARLDVFVDSYARRFDFRRMQVRDVRLTATLPDGKPLQIEKPFQSIGLEHTLGGAVGKKP